MQHSFLKDDFRGFVLSIDDRQHFVFNIKGVFVGVVILGDITYGVGVENLKNFVWCHEFIISDSTNNLLDFVGLDFVDEFAFSCCCLRLKNISIQPKRYHHQFLISQLF